MLCPERWKGWYFVWQLTELVVVNSNVAHISLLVLYVNVVCCLCENMIFLQHSGSYQNNKKIVSFCNERNNVKAYICRTHFSHVVTVILNSVHLNQRGHYGCIGTQNISVVDQNRTRNSVTNMTVEKVINILGKQNYSV